MAKGFKDGTMPGEGLKNQVKMSAGDTALIFIPSDHLEEWDEIWPVFPDGQGGVIKRRFVGDLEEKNANLAPIYQYKKEMGVPEGLSKQDANNWKNTHRYGTVVAVGTETNKVITKAMLANAKKKSPKLYKKLAAMVKGGRKSIRSISWDKTQLKPWIFGVEIYRKLMSINQDADNVDKLLERGINIEESLVTNHFYIKVEKIKKGKNAWEIDYNVTIGDFVGSWDLDETNFAESAKELEDHVSPSPESQVDDFISENGGGFSSGSSETAEEAPSVDEEDDGLDIPGEEDDLNLDDGIEEAPVEEAPVEETAAEDDGDLDLDDLDGLLED